MRLVRWIIFGLIVASLGGGLGASQDGKRDHDGHVHPNSAGKNRSRGNQQGSYVLTIAGHYRGQGTASVGDTVSLQGTVTAPGGATGTLEASSLLVYGGYFRGAGTVMGTPCTFQGRVDISAAQDGEETDRQATTGRLTGTFKTADGKVGRLVAVQGNAGKKK